MSRSSRQRASACLCACMLLLGGCAAPAAFREGQSLVSAGHFDEGVAKLEDAVRLDPGNAQYRISWRAARDQRMADLLGRAERLHRDGDWLGAQSEYRAALAVQPTNERAWAGLASSLQRQRLAASVDTASALAARKDTEGARALLKAVLLEEPRHEAAAALLRRLDDETASPVAPRLLAEAFRKPITIEFKDVPLKTVFEVLSRTSGLNIIFDKDVRTDQKTSIFLKNSTVEDAIGLMLLGNQLEQRVLNANTLLLYPNNPAKQKDYQPLSVRSFFLANAEAKVVAATLKSILKTRDLVVDDKLNLLIVRDNPEAIRLAEKLVALQDIPEPEVMLEVEILEVKRSRLLGLGARWPDTLSLSPIASASGAPLTLADLRQSTLATTSVGIGPFSLNARKSDTDANILANPRIRARNHEKAKILIGSRVPNITTTSTSTGFVAESVTYLDVGLKLDVEPSIHLDGDVVIKIALEVSSIISQVQTKSGTTAYEIGTRTAQTVLRLKDGENEVLAGLINDEDRRSADKVPALGEVPVLGLLFGSRQDNSSKTEIVLSITPRVIRNIRRPEASAAEFDTGPENSTGSRIGLPAATVPADPPAAAEPVPKAAVPAPAAAIASPVTSAAPAAAMRQDAVLRWQGPGKARVGETFHVQLLMQASQPVAAIPLALSFDPRTVQVVSVQEGDFLRAGGAAAHLASRIDPSGQVILSATREGETGAAAAGVLASFVLKAVGLAATGEPSRLQLLSAAPAGPTGKLLGVQLPAPFELTIGD